MSNLDTMNGLYLYTDKCVMLFNYWIKFMYLFFCLLFSCVARCVLYVNNVIYIYEIYYYSSSLYWSSHS